MRKASHLDQMILVDHLVLIGCSISFASVTDVKIQLHVLITTAPMVVGSEEKTSDADFTAVCGDIAVIVGVLVKEEMELGGGVQVQVEERDGRHLFPPRLVSYQRLSPVNTYKVHIRYIQSTIYVCIYIM